MKNISFIKATLKDLKDLLRIEKSVAHLKIYSAMTNEKEWVDEINKNTVYIIKKGGVAVGNISYEKKGRNHVYLSSCVIDLRFQNRGIGSEALTFVLKKLKKIKRIDLVTHPRNTAAIILYLSFGFIIESWKDNYYGDGEPRLVLALMRKK